LFRKKYLMKKLIFVFFLGFLHVYVVAQTKKTVVKKHVEYLASDKLQGRNVGTKGIEKAATYIERYFKKNKVKPFFSSYRDTLGNLRKVAFNVVGVVPGTDEELKNEYVVIGAHYDHIGFKKEANSQDSIANGANDDASGTAAVLEFAKYFSKKHTNKRSIIFVLFTAEEMGLLGSEYFADRLREQNVNVYCMLNFEMIGVPMKGDAMSYVTGYDMSNIAEVINKKADTKLAGFLPTAKKYQLFKRSDNFSFYSVFAVPSHTFSTFDFTNFDHYHGVNDEADQMDYLHMTQFINQFIPAITYVCNETANVVKLK
ncbi:M28 family metallopeptidase, partial [Neptunitalea chrysea]|uniref:M28 family metallopeptidase n=1 Tax=Neptunitalea chrysea TaxID=1647581 RepID=UPI0024936A96